MPSIWSTLTLPLLILMILHAGSLLPKELKAVFRRFLLRLRSTTRRTDRIISMISMLVAAGIALGPIGFYSAEFVERSSDLQALARNRWTDVVGKRSVSAHVNRKGDHVLKPSG